MGGGAELLLLLHRGEWVVLQHGTARLLLPVGGQVALLLQMGERVVLQGRKVMLMLPMDGRGVVLLLLQMGGWVLLLLQIGERALLPLPSLLHLQIYGWIQGAAGKDGAADVAAAGASERMVRAALWVDSAITAAACCCGIWWGWLCCKNMRDCQGVSSKKVGGEPSCSERRCGQDGFCMERSSRQGSRCLME